MFGLDLVAGFDTGKLEEGCVVVFYLLRGIGTLGQIAEDFGEEVGIFVDVGGEIGLLVEKFILTLIMPVVHHVFRQMQILIEKLNDKTRCLGADTLILHRSAADLLASRKTRG